MIENLEKFYKLESTAAKLSFIKKFNIDFNNLIINFVVPGEYGTDDDENLWLQDSYNQIEQEYLSHTNKNDCVVYIFCLRSIDWNKGPLKLFVRRMSNNQFVDVEKFIGLNFFNAVNITALINAVLIEENRAFSNTTLVIYGHSSGYYFFGSDNPDESFYEKNILKRRPRLKRQMALIYYTILNRFQSVIWKKVFSNPIKKVDENIIPTLSPNTLVQGISKSGIRQFDTIVLAACNMQNVDVISTLSVSCRYIIASQSFLSVNCYLFSKLIINSGYVKFEHCVRIVDESTRDGNYKNKTAIGAIDTTKISDLLFLFNRFHNYLNRNFESFRDVIIEARNEIGYIPGEIDDEIYNVDLVHWLQAIAPKVSNKLPQNIIDYLQQLVKLITSDIAYMNQLWNNKKLNGLCIYFPKTKKDFESGDPIYGSNKFTNSMFSRSSRWNSFLNHFHKKNGR